MKNYRFIYFILFAMILNSCTNDSEDDLIDQNPQSTITYTNTIKPVIDNNCIICHTSPPQNGAPMALTSYNLVKDAILNRGLIDRISREQGAIGMMPNGGTRLPQNTINQFIEWSENNFPE